MTGGGGNGNEGRVKQKGGWDKATAFIRHQWLGSMPAIKIAADSPKSYHFWSLLSG